MRIVIAASSFAQQDLSPLDFLEKQTGIELVFNRTGKRLDSLALIQLLQDADGVIAGLERYDQAVLSQLPQLRVISRCGVGLDTIDLAFAKTQGIKILNTPDVVITPVSELTIALMFDLCRRITQQSMLMKKGQWQRLNGEQLSAKTVGIIGLGRIGRRVVMMLKSFGVEKILGYDVYPDQDWAKEQGVTLCALDELLTQSDIVSLHVNLPAGSTWCLNARELSLMKKTAVIVNTARGSLIDEAALYQALSQGQLAGAALDVFVDEPYTGPLAQLENVITTPHIATQTTQSRVEMEMLAATQLVQYLMKG